MGTTLDCASADIRTVIQTTAPLNTVIQPAAEIVSKFEVGQGPSGPEGPIGVGVPGPPGPPGPPGSGSGTGDLHYAYVQSTPAAQWQIPHMLGKRPSVSVFIDGVLSEGDVQHVDPNNSTVDFGIPVSGVAYLN